MAFLSLAESNPTAMFSDYSELYPDTNDIVKITSNFDCRQFAERGKLEPDLFLWTEDVCNNHSNELLKT